MPTQDIITKGRSTTTTHTVFSHMSGGTSPSPSTVTSVQDYTKYRLTRSWQNDPTYHMRISQKKPLPDQPYTRNELMASGYSRHERSLSTQFPYRVATTTTISGGGILGPGQLPSRISRNMVNSMLLERAQVHSWSVPVFLAESGKTLEMVTSRAVHLVKMVNQLKKGNIGTFLDMLHISEKQHTGKRRKSVTRSFNRDFGSDSRKAAGNAWLETTYGWTPFLSDAKSAVNTLMDLSEYEGPRLGHVKATLVAKYSSNSSSVSNGVTTSIYKEQQESQRAVWRFSLNPSSIPARLGLTNPAVVAWELIPFSFVVDWFLPIGDYFDKLDSSIKFSHYGGTYGSRIVTSQTEVESGGTATYQVNSISTGRAIRISRSQMGTMPFVSLSSIVEKRFDGLSTSRLVSALALLQQNLKWFR